MSLETVIESLGAQGDGVTESGIFVPFALPGERVRVAPSGHRARLERVLDPAPERIAPVCPHFGVCGGCALQHASDRLVADWKRDLVHRALKSRGIDGVDVRPTLVSPSGSRRRATFAGRRTRKGVIVGFHAPGSDRLVAVEACPVTDPAVLKVLPSLAALTELGAGRKGTLGLTVTASDSGPDVAVSGGKRVEGPLYGELVAVAATRDLARLSWNGEVVVSRRQPVQWLGRARVVPPPGGFLQATREGEAALVAAMREAVGSARRLADLFCGSGTFALPLAEGAEVLAVDSDAEALAALDAGWRGAAGLKRVSTEVRDLLHRPLLARQLSGLEAVVFDPPRQGACGQAEQLAASDVPRIGAVSCNPATFARDARSLIDGGYRLDWVLPVDQFRWSPHVELAAAFSRVGAPA